jgi:hypothetical protein
MAKTKRDARHIARILVKDQARLYFDGGDWVDLTAQEALTMLGGLADYPIGPAGQTAADWYKARNKNQERLFIAEWERAAADGRQCRILGDPI